MSNPECDIETGICEAAASGPAQSRTSAPGADATLIYVGDPMCSWCWGIAPALAQLQQYCAQRGVPFRVVVGGLRAGGGDAWTEQFKQFLAHHWQEIGRLTGQPFSYHLLSWPDFEYDTEPACRSVVAARLLLGGSELGFFAAVQRKFYVENEDPKQIGFYRSICAEFGLDFGAFTLHFESEAVRTMTRGDFQLSRDLGVSGFPSILVLAKGQLDTIATGFSTFEKMQQRLNGLIGQTA